MPPQIPLREIAVQENTPQVAPWLASSRAFLGSTLALGLVACHLPQADEKNDHAPLTVLQQNRNDEVCLAKPGMVARAERTRNRTRDSILAEAAFQVELGILPPALADKIGVLPLDEANILLSANLDAQNEMRVNLFDTRSNLRGLSSAGWVFDLAGTDPQDAFMPIDQYEFFSDQLHGAIDDYVTARIESGDLREKSEALGLFLKQFHEIDDGVDAMSYLHWIDLLEDDAWLNADTAAALKALPPVQMQEVISLNASHISAQINYCSNFKGAQADFERGVLRDIQRARGGEL